MRVDLDWPTFQTRYLIKNRVFALEKDYSWILYTNDDIFLVRCEVEKSSDQTENIMFIERYLGGAGIIKVLSIPEESEDIEEEVEQEFYSDDEILEGIDDVEEEPNPERER